METKDNSTHERNIIKRQALEKLNKLLEAELKRLHDISPKKALFEQFEIISDNNYFTPEEFEEVKSNIVKLNQISSDNANERDFSINFLKTMLQIGAIEWPWSTQL